jgi:hypothetical protein
MGKTTYQSYTSEVPIATFRDDFIHRGAMCAAIAKRYPALQDIATEAEAIIVQIDSKMANLQKAEDDQIRARAIEIVEKLDVVEIYAELRRTMFAKNYDIETVLPDAPSALRRLGITSTAERIAVAISNLAALPAGDPIKDAFLTKLKTEYAELDAADKAEDKTRLGLHSGRVALTLYKSELSQTREAQMGKIQTVLMDREKSSIFALPWRKVGKSADEPATEPDTTLPGAPEATPLTP